MEDVLQSVLLATLRASPIRKKHVKTSHHTKF
jgi:hypothetical protein